jgi:hypothetical protein
MGMKDLGLPPPSLEDWLALQSERLADSLVLSARIEDSITYASEWGGSRGARKLKELQQQSAEIDKVLFSIKNSFDRLLIAHQAGERIFQDIPVESED